MKRDKRLYPLSWEHHEVLLFADRIKMALISEHPQYRHSLTDLLERTHRFWNGIFSNHMSAECEILFLYLKKYKELHVDIQMMETEFKNCLDLYSEISNDLIDENIVKKRLVQLAGLLIHHVRYEEQELFRKLQILVPKEEFDVLGTELQLKLPRVCRSSGF